MTSPAEWNTAPARSAGSASVLDRIIAILDAVRESRGSISITELAARTGPAEVDRVPSRGGHDPAALPRAHRGWGDARSAPVRARRARQRPSPPHRGRGPIIKNLWDLTGERVGLWVHQGTDMVSIAAVPGRLPMLSTRAGMRSPALTTASGKAYLAFCADQSVVDRVSAPLNDDAADHFRDELSQVRASVVATDREVSYPGILAVASPVLSADRVVLAAISIAGPSGAMDPESVAPLVRAAGVTLSRRLAAA